MRDPTLIDLDQWEYLFLFLKKAATSERCVFNIIIIFQFIIICEIGSNERCSKIVNFNRTEAGLTSKWGRISPAVQWCYQNQSNCTTWRRTASREIENFNLLLFFNPSPSSCGVTDLEAAKGAASGAAECRHVLCIYWLTVQLLRDQLSSSVHNLYSLAPGLWPVYTICTV